MKFKKHLQRHRNIYIYKILTGPFNDIKPCSERSFVTGSRRTLRFGLHREVTIGESERSKWIGDDRYHRRREVPFS